MIKWRPSFGTALRVGASVALALIATSSHAAFAQTVPGSDRSPVEDNPLTCWWRADKNAVHIGERFTLVLTCSAAESGKITVVPDLAPLDATALKLTPFEVVSGTAQPDIYDPPRRYIQREYTVRLLGQAFFGRDVDIPSILVQYTIHSGDAQNSTEGRSQAYALPPLPVRVLSLVPQKAADIQDSAADTFGAIQARQRRATNELVAAGVLIGFAVVLLGFAGAQAVRRRFGQASSKSVPGLSPRLVLGGCLREMSRLKGEVARDGWTLERTSRALTMLRIAAAVALGRPVTQTAEPSRRMPAREGQLELRAGVFQRRRIMVSAPTTPATIARTASHRHMDEDVRGMEPLAEIRSVLGILESARYGRDVLPDSAVLDAALEGGTGAVHRLRRLQRGWRRATAFPAQAIGRAGSRP